MASDSASLVKAPSKAWYLLPIFLGGIGGLIMFFVLKDKNRRLAEKGLLLGIIMYIVVFILLIITCSPSATKYNFEGPPPGPPIY